MKDTDKSINIVCKVGKILIFFYTHNTLYNLKSLEYVNSIAACN